MSEGSDKSTGFVQNLLNDERDARSRLLDAAGLHGPVGKVLASALEIAVGGTMVGLGIAASESGIGIGVAAAGGLIVADGVKGISDDVLSPAADKIENVLSSRP